VKTFRIVAQNTQDCAKAFIIIAQSIKKKHKLFKTIAHSTLKVENIEIILNYCTKHSKHFKLLHKALITLKSNIPST